MLECKAQGSFELLLLVAFIVSLSLILATYFLQENDRTRIEALAKSIVLEELNKESNFYFINEVEFVPPSTINICLKPRTMLAFDSGSLSTALISRINGISAVKVCQTDTQACDYINSANC